MFGYILGTILMIISLILGICAFSIIAVLLTPKGK